MPPATNASSSFTFLPQGAIIQEFRVAGKNIVQSFPHAQDFREINTAYFGETIGRTTNRVKDAVIKGLNGKDYELKKNNGPNSLHGGVLGWGKRDWHGPVAEQRNGREGVKFVYESKDGDEGYPGTVEARVWYTAWEEEGKTLLEAEYEVEMVGDEVDETVVGVTNHRYIARISCTAQANRDTVTSTSVTAQRSKALKLRWARTNTSRSMPLASPMAMFRRILVPINPSSSVPQSLISTTASSWIPTLLTSLLTRVHALCGALRSYIIHLPAYISRSRVQSLLSNSIQGSM